MKLVAKTMRKVVIKITTHEIEKKGFEFQWDKIRRAYPATKYDVHSIGSMPGDENVIYIELIFKRLEE